MTRIKSLYMSRTDTFFFLQIFLVWLVEFAEGEPVDAEDLLNLRC
jgi:hypothetical protein